MCGAFLRYFLKDPEATNQSMSFWLAGQLCFVLRKFLEVGIHSNIYEMEQLSCIYTIKLLHGVIQTLTWHKHSDCMERNAVFSLPYKWTNDIHIPTSENSLQKTQGNSPNEGLNLVYFEFVNDKKFL